MGFSYAAAVGMGGQQSVLYGLQLAGKRVTRGGHHLTAG